MPQYPIPTPTPVPTPQPLGGISYGVPHVDVFDFANYSRYFGWEVFTDWMAKLVHFWPYTLGFLTFWMCVLLWKAITAVLDGMPFHSTVGMDLLLFDTDPRDEWRTQDPDPRPRDSSGRYI